MKRVLLVEDDVAFAQNLLGLLRNQGTEVIHETTAKEANHRVTKQDFDLVIVDYVLGGDSNITGDSVLKNARRFQPQARRLLISREPAVAWQITEDLADRFLLKDLKIVNELVAEVENLGGLGEF